MKRLIPFLFVLVFFTSCREEVIPPGNPSGNVNTPVREVYFNSYSFIINAEDITYNLYDYLRFDVNRTQVFLSIIDHISGSVEISLIGKSKKVIWNTVAESDIKGEYSKINTEIPESVIFTFNSFTGKFKLTVTRY